MMTERDSGTTDGEMGRALVIGLGVRGGGGGGLVAKSCLTLVTPWTIALPTQARKLEWVAMATHSNILPWRILWTEEPGGLKSMVSQRVARD